MPLVNYSFTALIDTDSDGDNIVASQAVAVRAESDAVYATIYSDSAGTSPISQPGAVTDSNGVLSFYVLPGYYTITSGTRTETVLIDDGSRLNPDTVSDMAASKHIKVGEKGIKTKENSTGNGGGGTYDCVTVGTTPNVDLPNGYNIIVSAVDATKCFVLRLEGVANISQFGAIGDSTTNNSGAIQAASDTLLPVYIPKGDFGVLTTVTFPDEATIFGDGEKSQIIPLMTGGAVVFDIPARQFVTLRDFIIDSKVRDATAPKNCIGISLYAVTAGTRRYFIDNVTVWGCETGWDLTNCWIATISVRAYFCGTGFKGAQLNSVILDLQTEACVKSVEISSGNCLKIVNFLDESGPTASVVTGTIDNCLGLEIKPYLEWDGLRTVPFLTIGGTTECRAVEIHSAAVTGMAADSFAIVCDQVDGLKIHGWFENVEPNQTPRTIVDITANCKNVELAYTQHTDLTGTDESLSVGRVENYWPNSQFHGWLRGWKSIGQTRCTLSKETTTVRSGANALKVTATAANNFNYQEFLIDSDNVDLNALAGKTLTICAWVFIPDQTNFGSALRTNKALVSLHCDSTASGFINGTQNVSYVKNRWNLLVNTISMPTDPIDLRARFYVNNSATNMAGTEYIIVDSCYVIEGDNRHRAVLDGDVQDYHGISPLFIGGKMRHIADTVPSDTDLSYEVGDIIEYRTPTASSFVGEVCVTAGTGATAVFKTYGVTSA